MAWLLMATFGSDFGGDFVWDALLSLLKLLIMAFFDLVNKFSFVGEFLAISFHLGEERAAVSSLLENLGPLKLCLVSFDI